MQSHWDDRRLGVHLSCRSLKEDRLVPPGSPVSLLTRTSLVRPRSRPNAAKHLAAQFTQDAEFSTQINPATQQIACKNTDALLCTPCAEARRDGGRFGRHITPPCAVADKGTRPAHNAELAPRGPKTPRAQRGAFADLWGALHALGAHPLYASIRLSSCGAASRDAASRDAAPANPMLLIAASRDAAPLGGHRRLRVIAAWWSAPLTCQRTPSKAGDFYERFTRDRSAHFGGPQTSILK